MNPTDPKQIGTIDNYYGSLFIKEDNGRYFWTITDVIGDYWEEIPKELYDNLLFFEAKRNASS